MPDPIEHDLSNRALAIDTFARRLVIDRLGQAIDRAPTIIAPRAKHEFARGIVDALSEGLG